MKAAVIDDLALCREEMHSCFSRYLEENFAGEIPDIDDFSCGEDFLSVFEAEAYDIIFIDQYMDGLSGIDTATRIRGKDALVALVFVTTSKEHAIDSYGVRACGYLVKPYTYDDFKKTMELARLDKLRNARSVQIEKTKVLLRDILWCDRDKHYVEIHTDKRGVLRIRTPFADFAEQLAPYPQLLACYRGSIVNLDRAERIEELEFIMDTGERVPFSVRERKKIQAQFDEYLFRREREDELL